MTRQFNRSHLLAALLVVAPLCSACMGSQRDRFVRFLAGYELLRRQTTLGDTAQARTYAQLVDLTGIDSREACRIAEKYKNRPAAWNEVVLAVRQLLENLGAKPEDQP